MTKPDLKLIRERCEKAKKYSVMEFMATLSTIAIIDTPQLLAYIEKLEKQISFVKCCARSGESFTNEDLEKL